MGIFEFLQKKLGKADFQVDVEVGNNEKEVDVMPELPKHPPLSMFELRDADWNEFGKRLKFYKLLPNSYDTKNAEVDTWLDKKGVPCVSVTYKSKTSATVRRYDFFQQKDSREVEVHEWINGACRTFDGNKKRNDQLNAEGRGFVTYLNCRNSVQKHNEMYEHVKKGREMIEDGNKLTQFLHLPTKEREFIEEHKDDSFDYFAMAYFSADGAAFVKFTDEGKGREYIKPFTPKTLEFCVSKLRDEEKVSEYCNIEDFREKCRDIQESSLYDTSDWDKAIESCIDMLVNSAQKYKEELAETMGNK